MYLSKERKSNIFQTFGRNKSNTGCPESQIALFTFRMKHLTDHLKHNKKDYNTQHALIKLVGKRRKMLNYLKSKDIEKYRSIIKELGLRK